MVDVGENVSLDRWTVNLMQLWSLARFDLFNIQLKVEVRLSSLTTRKNHMTNSKHITHGLTFANRQFHEVGVFSFILSTMHTCMNGSVHNQSRVYLYSGAERSRKPLTRRGNSKGEETYQAYVESPFDSSVQFTSLLTELFD